MGIVCVVVVVLVVVVVVVVGGELRYRLEEGEFGGR